MNVNQRKLFRPRNARNRLNQMGGIMASSPELMQTIQGFQEGGNVSLAEMQKANDPRFFRRLGANLANLPAAAYDTVIGLPASTLQNAATAFQYSPFGRAMGLSEPGETRPPYVGAQPAQAALRDVLQANQPLTPEKVAAQLESVRQEPEPPTSDIEFYPDEALRSLQVGYRSMTEPDAAVAAAEETGVVREPMQSPQTEAELAADAQDNQMLVEAAKKGELGAAEQVKAVVQQGTPEEREQSIAELMNEFKQNAPEYKGMDRGLAIAKIGFAMAAGQDPRAIVNISKALSDGASMLMQDDKERAAFNRQVELSALQYGLGELGKRRAQDRLDQRTLKEYVAGEDFTWKGQKYEKGDTVSISQADFLANGGRLPAGLLDKTVYAAGIKTATDRLKAIQDAADELRKEKIISDSVLDKRLENYKSATNTIISAEAGIQLTENAILDVVEGRVTGISNSLGDLMNRTANSIGINLGKGYESVADFRKDIRQVFQEMIPVTLGEAQSANSISNRDVEFLADAFISAGALRDGVFDLAFVDDDILAGQLQGAIRKMRQAQSSAVAQMTQIEKTLFDRTVAGGGQASEFIQPYREQVEPYLPTKTGRRGQGITSTLGMAVTKDDQGRNVYDLTGEQ